MTELIAVLSTGKGTWSEVAKLINGEDWEKVFLITNDFGKNTFKKTEKIEFILIELDSPLESIIDQIKSQLKEKVMGPEVAINYISGTGKEHMALISSLLQLGLGIRQVITTSEGKVKEI